MITPWMWIGEDGMYNAELENDIVSGETLEEFAENVKQWIINYHKTAELENI